MISLLGRSSLACVLGALLCASNVSADVARVEDPHEPTYVLAIDIPVTVAGFGVWGLTSLLENHIGPTTCRWCDTPSSLNDFDRLGRNTFRSTGGTRGATASDVLAYGVVPAFAFGLDLAAVFEAGRPHKGRRFLIDSLLIMESVTTAMSITQLSKFGFARRRPDKIDQPTDEVQKHVDDNLSFTSGHTTLAFALATSAGTLASMRHERLAPLVWVLGLTAATATGMLRVVADRHFTSDVFAGAFIGSVVGVVVPVLHRGRSPVSLGGTASSHMGVLTVSGQLK